MFYFWSAAILHVYAMDSGGRYEKRYASLPINSVNIVDMLCCDQSESSSFAGMIRGCDC